MRVSLIVLLTFLSGCSTVRSSWIRNDYARTDRTDTLRLTVVTAPAPTGDTQACELMSLIARRYTNQKRDFIAKESGCATERPTACPEGIEGMIHLLPTAEVKDAVIKLKVVAEMVRCSDQSTIWKATGQGVWPKSDKKVKELAGSYGEELGPSVIPWVPASFHLLRAMLDTLPRPILMGEDAVMEKIELGE
jgi:probable lipoprotein (TIGR04455 family)